MRETLDKVDPFHEMRDLLLEAIQPDTCDGNHLPGVEVQCQVHDAELPALDAVSELLQVRQLVPETAPGGTEMKMK